MLLERIGDELLDAERELLLARIDLQHDGLDLVAHVVEVAGVLEARVPGEVGHVHEPVDPLFDAQEDSEVRDVLDLGLEARAGGVLLLEGLPRVLFDLLHAQADLLVLDVDVDDHRLDLVADGDHLRRVLDATGPAHFADVDQTLDAVFELDERAVVGQADHATLDALAHAELLGHATPRVFGDLLEAQADALALFVELEHHHLDLVADVEHFGRVVDPAPAHVGDVQQAVDAAEVDEATVLGDVLDDALDHRLLD